MAQLERPQRQLETTAKAPPAIHTMEQLLREMAQLERPQRQLETTAKAPPAIHTMEQLLQGESSKSSKNSPTCSSSPSSNLSSPSSPFFQRLRSSHDSEDDHSQNPKKSILTKVKEKAKKLRHSLSKKKHEDGNLSSPSSATAAEGDGAEEDAEFLGAPMYESEKTSTGYKPNAKQIPSPRANPMIPEKHVVSSSDKHVVEQDHERSLYRSLSKRTTHPATIITATTPNATTASVTNVNVNTHPSTPSPLNKTTTETTTPKLSTVRTEKPDVAHATSKVQGLTVSKPSELHDHPSPSSPSSSSPAAFAPKTSRSNLSYSAPRTPLARVATSQFPTTTPRTTSAPITLAPSAATSLSGKNTSPTAQIWDKGVSMKEYFLNKLEPGEDEKALSQVISEAMSPRKTPGDAGVMEKVREVVTSLLRTEEPAKYADATNVATPSTTRLSPQSSTRLSPQSPLSINASRAPSQIPSYSNASRASSQMPASTSVSRTSSQVPISYNAQQDYTEAQEENHGRILQAN
ncbi:mucin-5AC-like [Vigna radiata var. radiata]|uniref:Mucin-5AC-like n=1 Tax=Vigna radiata var. radiata TaxID=3916 RepID=A0A1S3VUV5_VIGRR|nr:mucin-5AC-like [Vigna radiata var. radiata]